MSEESIDKKKIRQFRLVAAFALLIVAGGFLLAFRMDSDIIAGITCLVLGITLVILGKDKNDARLRIGIAIGIGLVAFFLWMFVKFLIAA